MKDMFNDMNYISYNASNISIYKLQMKEKCNIIPKLSRVFRLYNRNHENINNNNNSLLLLSILLLSSFIVNNLYLIRTLIIQIIYH
jgi:hypothetical protein